MNPHLNVVLRGKTFHCTDCGAMADKLALLNSQECQPPANPEIDAKPFEVKAK